MEIPEILQKYYKTWYQIKILRLKADGMRKSLYGKGASGSQSSSMNTHDGMSKGILTMIDYEKKADNLKKELDRIRNETENIIEKVQDDNQKELLVRRYLLFQNWKDIAKSMNYSRSYTFEIHRNAVETVNSILNHTES